jgi:hypothetical protein
MESKCCRDVLLIEAIATLYPTPLLISSLYHGSPVVSNAKLLKLAKQSLSEND